MIRFLLVHRMESSKDRLERIMSSLGLRMITAILLGKETAKLNFMRYEVAEFPSESGKGLELATRFLDTFCRNDRSACKEIEKKIQ